MTRLLTLCPAALLAASALGAQHPDSSQTDTLATGVTHTRLVRAAGPWVAHIVRVDRRRAAVSLEQVRANDRLTSRERVTSMVARRTAAGARVLAAVNADFFELSSGANENNVVIDGEWWQGQRVTNSPFDTFDNIHAQFAVDAAGRPLLDRFAFDGWARTARGAFPLIALNALPGGTYEGAALWTARYGATTPRDTSRATTELTLTPAGRRGDTTLFVRRSLSKGGASVIPREGAVLAAYGARTAALDSTADGDTVRVTLAATPWPADRRAKAPQVIIGGWPRLLRDGVNVAARAAADEGTISRNAEARHPRTAVAFSRDSSTLWIVTVDGRSTASAGMTTVELAEFLRGLGAWNALNFDGGGSTAMVLKSRVVNVPSDRTGEREVGNALLLIAR
ncbi:MAG: phosphodiester glycosidase family protein [Gemmatimonadota bacterium]|nr:phosphodiester glycosidase family protein [Gemmatimonadota bacterium]